MNPDRRDFLKSASLFVAACSMPRTAKLPCELERLPAFPADNELPATYQCYASMELPASDEWTSVLSVWPRPGIRLDLLELLFIADTPGKEARFALVTQQQPLNKGKRLEPLPFDTRSPPAPFWLFSEGKATHDWLVYEVAVTSACYYWVPGMFVPIRFLKQGFGIIARADEGCKIHVGIPTQASKVAP